MQQEEVSAVLLQDIQSNMALFQIGGLLLSLLLAVIGVVLAIRAYAVLSEARELYWAADNGAEKMREPAMAVPHQKPRKIRSNRLRGLM